MTDTAGTASTAGELRVAIGRVSHRIRQLWVSAESVDGISFTEGAILTHLARGGASSPGDLAGNERVTSQAITAHLTNLERRDLIARSPDPRDGRRVVVNITPAGRAALADRETVLLGRIDHVLSGFGEKELRTIAAASTLLLRLADQL